MTTRQGQAAGEHDRDRGAAGTADAATPHLGSAALRARRAGFRLLVGSHVLNETGAAATLVVLPLTAVLALDASAWQTALIESAYFAAYLVLGLPAGALVERARLRRVMIASDVVRCVALAALPLAWAGGVLTLPMIYGVALLLGGAQLFGDIADHSYLPHLVSDDRLIQGNSALQLVRSGAELGGPGLGGLSVQGLGAYWALTANAVASAVSAVLLWRIAVPEAKPPRPPHGLARQTWEGLRFVRGHPVLRAFALSACLNNLVFSGAFALDVVFLSRTVGVAPGLVGVLLASGAVGALLGAWLTPRLAHRFGDARTAVLAVPVAAPFLLLTPLTGDDWRIALFALAHVAISVGVTAFNILQVTYRQRACPPGLLSRVSAIFRFAVWGVAPLGALIGGALAAHLGVRTALWVLAGALIVVAPLLLCSPLRRMKTFDVNFPTKHTSC
ncbi:MFS transporter [Streptomyces longispororuber]|uniref:MFS transporter n=1 Tax=Streptomyces longispororuber TaxID=68230 RepID=A0A918ZU86_9ACTN|nr:MFS transporter [Streptomyces longispororuber]GHE70275.1 MFS transporter [Streptomyces longispororuber]